MATMDERMVCRMAVTQLCACVEVSADRRYSWVGRLMYQHPGGDMLAIPVARARTPKSLSRVRVRVRDRGLPCRGATLRAQCAGGGRER